MLDYVASAAHVGVDSGHLVRRLGSGRAMQAARGAVMAAVRWYDGALNRNPLRTKIATSFTVLTTADVARQFAEGSPSDDNEGTVWDPNRTLIMSVWGLTAHPTTIHNWFNFLERFIGPSPVRGPKLVLAAVTARKVVTDQFLASPFFLGSFIAYSALMRGEGVAGAQQRLREDWFTMTKAGWSTWFVAHTINFSLVPLHWRLLYINIVTLGFGTFLSLMASRGGGGVRTPVDTLYDAMTGSDTGFDQRDNVAKFVGACWVPAIAAVAWRYKHMGMLGLGCCAVGATAATLQVSTVLGCDRFWSQYFVSDEEAAEAQRRGRTRTKG